MLKHLVKKVLKFMKRKICVFCGSSNGLKPVYLKTASRIGKIIGKNEFDLVFGGGGTGLMETVALGANSEGSKIYGVIPDFLTKYEIPMSNINLTITSSMRERKAKMYKLASIFIVLPGGLGTLDECVEVLTLIQLKQIKNKPVVIFNLDGYWNFFFSLIKKMIKEGFLKRKHLNNFIEFKKLNNLETFLKSF